jgi:F-type H+-transporting ATPase subunit c
MTNLILSILPAMLAVADAAPIEPKAMAAISAGLAIGLGALGSSLAMGNLAGKALEAGSRQPEIFSKIQTLMLMAIVFVESLCIYSLVVALLLIFTF